MAVVTQWRGGNGAFSNAANWSNGVPAAVDDARFGFNPFTGNNAAGTISGNGSVTELSTDGFYGPFTFTGAITTITAHLYSQTTFSPGASLTLAGTNGASGYFKNTVTFDGASLGGAGASIEAGFDAASPTTLAFTNGAVANVIYADVGQFSTSTNAVNVSGSASRFNVVASTPGYTGQLVLGFQGSTGALNLGTGARATIDRDTALGTVAQSTGTVSVTGGAALLTKGVMRVGGAGTGTVQVSGGGSIRTNATTSITDYVGESAGSVGTVTVDGTGSSWASGNQLIIGNSGRGTLTLTNGAALTAGLRLAVGQLAGSQGTLTLAGGASASSGGDVFIGNAAGSSGSVTVGAGSALRSTRAATSSVRTLFIGAAGPSGGNAAAQGSLIVTGANALLDLNGNAASVDGAGSLSVLAGGTALFGALDPSLLTALSVGRFNGEATATIDGTNSSIQARNVVVGRTGIGHMVVGNGGTLTLNGTDVTNDGLGIGWGGTSGSPTSFGGRGDVTVNSGGTIALGGGTVTVGNGTAANGRLTINAGGALRSTAPAQTGLLGLAIASNSAADAATTATVVVTGAGATLDMGGNAGGVGLTGNGTLTVSSGGTARFASSDSRVVAALGAGRNVSGRATITVTGADSSLIAAGSAYLGRAGDATLVVDQGATFTAGLAGTGVGFSIGDGTAITDAFGNTNTPYFGGTGAATVGANATLRSLGSLTVGNRGSTGTLTIGGTGSLALADRAIIVGSGADRAGGAGIVTVNAGGTLRSTLLQNGSASIILGDVAGTNGTVTVGGAAALVDAGGARLVVGRGGTGNLAIRAGGTVRAGGGYTDTEAALAVGSLAGGSGTVLVAGTGAQLVATGQAVLGGDNSGAGLVTGGAGTLSVTNGGLFRATALSLRTGSSLAANATGTAVLGSGSGTAGALTIEAGRTVTAAGGIIAANVTGPGTLANAGGTLTVNGNLSGATALSVGTGLLQINGTLGAAQASFTAPGATLRTRGLTGSGTVTSLQPGARIDLAGVTDATLATDGGGTTLTQGTAASRSAPHPRAARSGSRATGRAASRSC